MNFLFTTLLSWFIMTIVYWNYRGIGNEDTIRHFQFLGRNFKPHIFLIAEPMVENSKIQQIAFQIGMSGFLFNSAVENKAWIFFKDYVNIHVLKEHKQAFTFTCEGVFESCTQVFFIYADNERQQRKDLWDHLVGISNTTSLPWILLGDFNCYINTHEKVGGTFDRRSAKHFSNFINEAQVFERQPLLVQQQTWK